MKLFHKLLVAPAAIGLLAPLSVSANEVDINSIANYVLTEEEEIELFDSSTFSKDLANSDILSNEINSSFYGVEAGSFSDTTVMTGSATFAVAGADGEPSYSDPEALVFNYFFDIDLDTSFTGDDNLNIGLEAGNTASGTILSGSFLDFGTGAGDTLSVVDVNYTRSFGDLTLAVGDSYKISKQFDGACAYSGFTTTLSDCGTGASAGLGGNVTLAGNYAIGNGFTFGGGISSTDGDTTKGIFSKESDDMYGMQLAYSNDTYGAAVSYANYDYDASGGEADTTFWGINGYYTIGSFIDSISVGYETGNPDDGSKDTTMWFAGIATQPIGPGTLNVGIGTSTHTDADTEELLIYEANYAWDFNDSISSTAGVFTQERSSGVNDITGLAFTTTFSF